MTYEKAVLHLEQSARHLESMTDGLVYELLDSDEVSAHLSYGRADVHERSCSKPVRLHSGTFLGSAEMTGCQSVLLFLILQDNDTQYARMYDLSRSSPVQINALVSDMITNGVSLETTNDLLRLASRQTPQTWRVLHAVQDCLTRILHALR